MGAVKRALLTLISSRAFLVSVAAFLLYNVNLRYAMGGDEWPHRLLPLALLRFRTLNLDPFLSVIAPDGVLPYFAVEVGGRVISQYPPGTGLLAVPFYLPSVLMGPEVPTHLFAKVAASGMVAIAAGFVFAALRRLGASPGPALWTTAVFALATPVFSMASQSLAHSPGTLLVAALLYSAVRSTSAPRFAVLAGLVAGAAVAVRPATAPAVLPIAALCWWWAREVRLPMVVAAAIPVVVQLDYNLVTTGRITGGYALAAERFASIGLPEMGFTNPLPGIAGLLASPGRGLLFYSPVVLLAAWEAVRAFRKRAPTSPDAPVGGLTSRRVAALLVAAGISLGATVVFFGSFTVWWGGFSYGPRYLCEVMPMAALLWWGLLRDDRAALPPDTRARRRWLVATFTVLAVVSFGVQTVGAFSYPCSWDATPVTVDEAPERNWDLWDNPIRRCIQSGPRFGGTGILQTTRVP